MNTGFPLDFKMTDILMTIARNKNMACENRYTLSNGNGIYIYNRFIAKLSSKTSDCGNLFTLN